MANEHKWIRCGYCGQEQLPGEDGRPMRCRICEEWICPKCYGKMYNHSSHWRCETCEYTLDEDWDY